MSSLHAKKQDGQRCRKNQYWQMGQISAQLFFLSTCWRCRDQLKVSLYTGKIQATGFRIGFSKAWPWNHKNMSQLTRVKLNGQKNKRLTHTWEGRRFWATEIFWLGHKEPPGVKSGSWVSSLYPTPVMGINQGSPGRLVYHFLFVASQSLMVMHSHLSSHFQLTALSNRNEVKWALLLGEPHSGFISQHPSLLYVVTGAVFFSPNLWK